MLLECTQLLTFKRYFCTPQLFYSVVNFIVRFYYAVTSDIVYLSLVLLLVSIFSVLQCPNNRLDTVLLITNFRNLSGLYFLLCLILYITGTRWLHFCTAMPSTPLWMTQSTNVQKETRKLGKRIEHFSAYAVHKQRTETYILLKDKTFYVWVCFLSF